MLKLERYAIDQSPGQITLRLEQKGNVVVNIIISVGIIAGSFWPMATSSARSPLYPLLGVGVVWLVAAMAGFRTRRDHVMTRDAITQTNQSNVSSIAARDLSHVAILKRMRSPGGQRRHRFIFRWHVNVIDKQGKEVTVPFELQQESSAEQLASIIADFYGLEVRKSTV